jgi:predicted CoA-binding protein
MSTASTVSEQAVATFLSGHRIALLGASDNPKNFSATVLKELVDHGYDVVPVNPGRTEVAGRACYAEIGFVPGVLDGVIVMVPSASAAAAVRSCIDAGVRNIWLFRGAGAQGSATTEASELCREAGVTVVDGACPLMFLEPTGWFHRVHRTIRRMRGDVVADRKQRA